jgi:uncharacterized protein
VELTLFLDHACNLRCSYCYGGAKFGRPMPAAVMRKAVDLALAQSSPALTVSFFGGEPLLHVDLVEETMAYVADCMAQPGQPKVPFSYVINSNGTLLDDRVLGLFAGPHRPALFVSLDGPADLHDRHRADGDGHGSHARIIANLARLREHHIPFSLLAVVRPEGARRLGDVVAALADQRPDSIILSADLHAPWTEEAVAELRQGLAAASEIWMQAFRQGQGLRLEPLHTKVLTHLHQGIPCPERCTLAGASFAVAPSGRIYPCAQMIGEDSRDDLVIGTVESGLDRRRITELQEAKDRVEETCRSCALRGRCSSHCGCQHWHLTGVLGRITATLCEIEEAFITAADQASARLFAEACPGFISTYYRKHYVPAPGSALGRMRKLPLGRG